MLLPHIRYSEDDLVFLNGGTSQLLPFHTFFGLSAEIPPFSRSYRLSLGEQLQFCYPSQSASLRKQQPVVVYTQRSNPAVFFDLYPVFPLQYYRFHLQDVVDFTLQFE